MPIRSLPTRCESRESLPGHQPAPKSRAAVRKLDSKIATLVDPGLHIAGKRIGQEVRLGKLVPMEVTEPHARSANVHFADRTLGGRLKVLIEKVNSDIRQWMADRNLVNIDIDLCPGSANRRFRLARIGSIPRGMFWPKSFQGSREEPHLPRQPASSRRLAILLPARADTLSAYRRSTVAAERRICSILAPPSFINSFSTRYKLAPRARGR